MAQGILAVVVGASDTAAGFARRLARTGFEADLLLVGAPGPPPGAWRRAWRMPHRSPSTVAAAVTSVLDDGQHVAVILEDDAWSREVAGTLAARLGLPVAGSVLAVRQGPDGLAVTRTVDGGARTANLVLSGKPALLIANPEASEAGTGPSTCRETIDLAPEEVPGGVQLLHESRLLPWDMDVTDGDVVVAGGRGIGGPEGFRLLAELAALLGGTVGASRVAVDAGWIPYARQIGLTGKSVAPRLYIACGISGALHHTLGMRHSSTIIAINSDPNAPILKLANVSVVGDLHEVIPALIREVRKRGGEPTATLAEVVS